MHHRITYMYINFQEIRFSRSVKPEHTNLFAKKDKLSKFASTVITVHITNVFAIIPMEILKNRLFQSVFVKRTCMSIFSKIGLIDQ